MATVTISLSGSSVVNGSKNWTISDADVQTLIDSIIDKRSKSPGATTPSNAQALVIWAQSFIDTTIAEDLRYRTRQAEQAGVIPPIVFT